MPFDPIAHQEMLYREAISQGDAPAMQRCVDQVEWTVLERTLEVDGIITSPSVRSAATGGAVRLGSLIVPKQKRGQGLGTHALRKILDLCDKQGRTMVISPATDFGGSSVERLKKFYARSGFVRNKGSKKDFTISELMYRLPFGRAHPSPAIVRDEKGGIIPLAERYPLPNFPAELPGKTSQLPMLDQINEQRTL